MPMESQADLPMPTYQAVKLKAVVISQCQSDWLIKMVVNVKLCTKGEKTVLTLYYNHGF